MVETKNCKNCGKEFTPKKEFYQNCRKCHWEELRLNSNCKGCGSRYPNDDMFSVSAESFGFYYWCKDCYAKTKIGNCLCCKKSYEHYVWEYNVCDNCEASVLKIGELIKNKDTKYNKDSDIDTEFFHPHILVTVDEIISSPLDAGLDIENMCLPVPKFINSSNIDEYNILNPKFGIYDKYHYKPDDSRYKYNIDINRRKRNIYDEDYNVHKEIFGYHYIIKVVRKEDVGKKIEI